MKEISAPPSGFFNRRVLLANALCLVGVLLAMLSFAANPPVPFKGNIAAMAASIPLNPIGPRWSNRGIAEQGFARHEPFVCYYVRIGVRLLGCWILRHRQRLQHAHRTMERLCLEDCFLAEQ